jgi:hypothetical protein
MKYRKYKNQNPAFWLSYAQKLKYKSKIERRPNIKMLNSGFSEAQITNALKKAWIAYSISDKNKDIERKQYYAAVIQKLERELGRTVTPFRELKMLALKYYSDNAELFKDDVPGGEVLKTMVEKGYKFGKQYKKQEGKVINDSRKK